MPEPTADSSAGRPPPSRPSGRRHGRRARVGSAALIAGAIANCAFLLEGYLGARLDRSVSFVSELGGRGEPNAIFFRLSDLVAGTLLLIGGAAALSLLPASRILRLGVVCSMVYAGLTLADAFLPLDCPPTVDPACRAAEEAGDVSWQHAAHNVTGALEGFTAPAAMLLIALGVWGLRRRGKLPHEWEGVWQFLVIVGVLYGAASLAIAVIYTFGGAELGILQRVQIVLYALAMGTIGMTLRGYRPPPAEADSAAGRQQR